MANKIGADCILNDLKNLLFFNKILYSIDLMLNVTQQKRILQRLERPCFTTGLLANNSDLLRNILQIQARSILKVGLVTLSSLKNLFFDAKFDTIDWI